MGLTRSDQAVSMQGVTLLIASMLHLIASHLSLYSTSVYETRGKSPDEQSAKFGIHRFCLILTGVWDIFEKGH